MQEITPERADLKTAVFGELDALAGSDAVIASSTAALAGRQRTLVAHPLNPPHLVPAVELVPAPWTSPETVRRAAAMMSEIGQSPIVLTREVAGFVMNRLQGALLHEAFRLVADGIVEPGDVDRAVSDGLGLRWSFMGPFETIDLNAPGGVADFIDRYGASYARMAPAMAQPVAWNGRAGAAVEAARSAELRRDRIVSRQAWRDSRLIRLAAHKRTVADEP